MHHPWFEIGKEAVQQLAQGISGYACPLCLAIFETFSLQDQNGLSREDVPPKHFGGKKIVLTCRRCNSTAGATVDAQLALNEKFRKIGGTDGLPAKLSVGDTDGWVWADFEFQPEENTIVVLPRNNPAATRRSYEQMKKAGEGSTIQLSFQGGVPRHASISLLRAAYLAAFAKFGYRFVARDVFDPIRQVISNPTSASHDDFHLHIQTSVADRRIGFVTTPAWAVALACQFDSHLILLPIFDDDNLYDRIATAKREGPDAISISMTALPFPTKPEHLLDFDSERAANCLGFLRSLATHVTREPK